MIRRASSCGSSKASQNQTDSFFDIHDQLIIHVTGNADAGEVLSLTFFWHRF
jgi:hypothetical protein